MALVDQITGSFLNQKFRHTNTVGTPIFSTADSDNGRMIADEYVLTVSARSGGTGTITVTASAPNNPFNGLVFTSLNFDNTTVYEDIVPGVDVVLDSDAVNGNTATVFVGEYLGSISSEGVGPGLPTDEVQHFVYNSGTGTVSDARARVLTQAIHVRKTGSVFSKIGSFAEFATEKTAGGGSNKVMPYVLTIANVAGSGASKTCDLQIDGVTFGAGTIRDVTTGNLVSGTGLKAIADYSYYVVSGPLQGFSFNIHPSCANADFCNILIFLNRYLQIAPDIGDTPGEFGTDDVVLTQDGEADGQIQPSERASYWARVLVPGDANNESNPYPCNVALSGAEMGQAGW